MTTLEIGGMAFVQCRNCILRRQPSQLIDGRCQDCHREYLKAKGIVLTPKPKATPQEMTRLTNRVKAILQANDGQASVDYLAFALNSPHALDAIKAVATIKHGQAYRDTPAVVRPRDWGKDTPVPAVEEAIRVLNMLQRAAEEKPSLRKEHHWRIKQGWAWKTAALALGVKTTRQRGDKWRNAIIDALNNYREDWRDA